MAKKVEGGILKSFSELNPVEDEDKNDRLLQGLVIATSDIEHYITACEIECSNCHETGSFTCIGSDFRKFNPPKKCSQCKIDLKVTKENKGTLRKLLLQENTQQNPKTLTCYLFHNQCLDTEVGDKLDIRGALRSVKKHQTDITFQRVFDINQLRQTEEKIKLPTGIDIENFKNITHHDLIKSFAPNILGMEDLKEALLISIIGGVQKGEDIRGDINMLMVGDPGTAKTKL